MRRIAGRPAVLLLALAALAAAPAPAQVVIDSFTTTQATISDPPGGASNVVTGGADILGQRRGLQVRRFAGAGPVSAGVAGGELDLTVAATTPDSNGAAFVTWDGDSDPNVLDPDGLGGVDLTAGGAGAFRFTISQAAAGTSLVLEVYEDADSVSRGGVVLPLIAAPVDIFVDFSSLATAPGAATPADLTLVGAITLRIEAGEASPAVLIDQIVTAVPEIAALKVDRTPAGDPIPGAVAPGDTIRYRITISNTGGGAAGVELADVLDANLALVAGSVRTTPLARPDVYRTVTDQPIDSSAAALPALLDNDVDPDGDALAAVPVTGQGTSQGGSVDVAADGHFVYTPPVGFNGVDDFPYTIAATAGDPTVDAASAPIGPIQARARIVIDRAPPVVTAGGTLAYTENDAATAIDPALTVTDADSVNLVSATVEITGNYQNGEDVLSFANTPNITGVFTSATGTLSLNGLDTVAAWQTALRSVAYENTSEDPDESDRTVTWIASDGVESSAPATSTIEVTAVNDPPAVTTSGGATSFVEDAGAVAVDGALTVTDADDTDLVSATVTLTNPQDGAQESLAVAAPAATCPGLVVSAPGHTLSITGTATVAVYQGCLRSVVYDHTSQNPTAAPDRVVSFVANDGDDPSNTAQKTVTVTPVNDPPVAGDDSWQSVGNTQLVIDLAALSTPHVRDTTPGAADGVRDNDSDPAEGNNHAVTGIVGCADVSPPFSCATANGGTVVIDAVGTFVYTPAAGDAAASDSFQYVLTDDGAPPASDTATVTIQRFERVWYVDNDFGAGGNGTSANPFNSLAPINGAGGAGDADGASDYIFVHFGDGTTTNQSSGFVLENGQRLLGEHVGLSIPVDLNGNGSPAVLFAAVAGNRPMLDDTVVGGVEGVGAFDVVPAEIAGLNLGGNVNALEWTTTAAFAGSGALIVRDNIVRAAGATGVDVNLAGTGALRLAFHDNNLTAAGTGLAIAETGTGSLTITAFDDNVVHGNTGGTGLAVTSATFDATPGLPINTVAGGTTAIGQSGNGIGGAGLVLTNVLGDLAFTDLDVFSDGGAGLGATSTGALNAGAGTGFRLTVPAAVATIDANGGPGVSVNNASVTLPLAFLESTNSTTTGLSLVNAFGGAGQTALSASSGQITDPVGASGAAVQITGGSGHVTLGIPITNTSGNAVSISSRTADTVSFTGAIAETGSGVSLTGNSGTALVSFRGGLTASTGASPAFTATGGGNIEVCDESPCNPGATGGLVNTLTTTTATALHVASTTISANRLEFRSIASNGGSSTGIILDGTGSIGGLTVNGDGTNTSVGGNGTGGTIANKNGADGSTSTGIGIYLNNTASVVLRRMIVNGTNQNFGIRGNSVSGLTLEYSTISGTNGTAASLPLPENAGEGSLYFGNVTTTGITGAATFTNLVVSGGRARNFSLINASGSLSPLTVTGSTFGHPQNFSNANDALSVEARNAGTVINAVLSGSTFTGAPGDLIEFVGQTGTTMDVDVIGNICSNNHPNNIIGGGGVTIATQGTMTFDLQNNSLRDANGSAVTLQKASAGTSMNGSVSGNTIGVTGVAGSGSMTGNGIFLSYAGGGTIRLAITNNQIRRYNGNAAIFADNTGGTYDVDFTVTGNLAAEPGAGAFAGLAMAAGAPSSADDIDLCAQIGGAGAQRNDFSAGDPANANDIILGVSTGASSIRLPGYAGSTLTDVQNFVFGNNNFAGTAVTAYVDPPATAANFVGGAACQLP